MKILVVDDRSLHQYAATEQLASEHEVTVVGSYDEAWTLLENDDQSWDVFLCDLFLPASGYTQMRNSPHVGVEGPYGIFLALYAAKRGVKQVAVFTDCNHHHHPASACFDLFLERYMPAPLTVEESALIMCNQRDWVDPETGMKNWKAVLEYLLEKT